MTTGLVTHNELPVDDAVAIAPPVSGSTSSAGRRQRRQQQVQPAGIVSETSVSSSSSGGSASSGSDRDDESNESSAIGPAASPAVTNTSTNATPRATVSSPRQYYYFYGSTTANPSGTTDNSNGATNISNEKKTDTAIGGNTVYQRRSSLGRQQYQQQQLNPISPYSTGGRTIASFTSAGTDGDSLVGECLISTDNEYDDNTSVLTSFTTATSSTGPNKVPYDFHQLLLTNTGTANGEMRPLYVHPPMQTSNTGNLSNNRNVIKMKTKKGGNTIENGDEPNNYRRNGHGNNRPSNGNKKRTVSHTSSNRYHNPNDQVFPRSSSGNNNNNNNNPKTYLLHNQNHQLSIPEDMNEEDSGCCGGFQQGPHQNNSSIFCVCVQRFMVGVTVGLVAWLAAVIVFPESRLAAGAETPSPELLHFAMPYREVDRGIDYNDPVQNFIDVSLFHPSLLFSTRQPNKNDDDKKGKGRIFNFPFPTGAFWTNFVLPPTADQGLSFPVAVYPYAYKWSNDKIEVSYPAAHRVEDPKAIHDYFFPDLTFGTLEVMDRRRIRSFDALSVTLRYYSQSDDSGKYSDTDNGWETYLVQGSPYVTTNYQSVTPTIHAFTLFSNVVCPRQPDLQSLSGDAMAEARSNQRNNFHKRPRNLRIGVCSSTIDTSNHISTLSGTQFILQTQEGMEWIIFASEPVTLLYDTNSRNKIVLSDTFNGVLRTALIPMSGASSSSPTVMHATSNTDNDISPIDARIAQSSGLQRLIYHAGVYPTSGGVSWSFRDASPSLDSSNTKTNEIVLETFLGNPSENNSSNTATTTTSSSSSSASSSYYYTKYGRIGTVTFKFQTVTWMSSTVSTLSGGNSPKPLLMLALPHHAQNLDPGVVQLSHDLFDLSYRCIKGPMRPVLGSSWSYDEPLLSSLGFEAEGGTSDTSNSRQYLHPKVRSEIIKNLHEDIKLALPTMTENIYGFGKQSARLAQLAYIASVIQAGNTSPNAPASTATTNGPPLGQEDPEVSTLQQKALSTLREAIVNLLRDKTSDLLVYDVNLGGLVSSDGLLDTGADFGNGRYNDHHFHYGYLLYACAILGKLDPSFVEEFSTQVDAVYFDVAHHSNFNSQEPPDGVFYPGSRHKVWFDGHSFASGMFPFGNGKSQESSSEAVNCYYGAYLWSLVRNGAADDPLSDLSPRTDFARLLLASEIRGAKTYWHMVPPSSDGSSGNSNESATVYSTQFSKNYMVGNLGMLDAVSSTWFGTQGLYVHMINLIPLTAITGELFGQNFVAQEYNQILKPLEGTVEMAWNGFVIADRAIIDPQGAWKAAQELFSPTLDSGLSKTQVLYFIATRDGFNASLIEDGDSGDKSTMPTEHGDVNNAAACSNTPSCATLGLTGNCCPSPSGMFLDCCKL